MKKFNISRIVLALALPLVVSVSGCHYHEAPPPPPPCSWGYDGVTGQAFFGLDWQDASPTYLWTNNQAIPSTFQYGAYYWSYPGGYELYYEGRVLENCCYVPYHWNVHFDIWVHPGTAGGCGVNGINGPDSYLMIYCGPYGPYETRTNKMGVQKFTVLSDTGDEIITEQRVGDVSVRATYTKVLNSRKGELDPTDAKVGTTVAVK
jgi:hypothetical protein